LQFLLISKFSNDYRASNIFCKQIKLLASNIIHPSRRKIKEGILTDRVRKKKSDTNVFLEKLQAGASAGKILKDFSYLEVSEKRSFQNKKFGSLSGSRVPGIV
jgi:hypothetical protein